MPDKDLAKIVIGAEGALILSIKEQAAQSLTAAFGMPVHLDLLVIPRQP